METEVAELKTLDHYESIKRLAADHGIKELKGRETAVYYPAGRKTDPFSGRVSYPVSVQIPTDEIIINPKTDEAVSLVYIESERWKRQDGRSYLEEVRPNIFIDGGTLILTAMNNRLYLHMEMLDQNGSKDGRNDSKRILFYREDKAKTAKQKLEETNVEIDALTLALTMPYEQAKEYAERLKLYDSSQLGNVTPDEIRGSLVAKAKQVGFVKFIKDSRNPKGLCKLRIKESKVLGIIVSDEFNWKWAGEKDPAKEVITKLDQDGDPIDGLVFFFLQDREGKKMYEKLIARLKREE